MVEDELPSTAQVRAARALLGWSQDRLAEESGTSRRTVATFELGGSIKPDSRSAMVVALERAGVEFIGTGRDEGVRRNDSQA